HGMVRFVINLALFSPALLSAQSVHGQTLPPTSNANAQDAAASLVRTYNNWGLKASTPNTSLAIKESARDGQIIKVRLYAAGVPKDKIYSIVAWPVSQKGPLEAMDGVTLDASGLAICAGTLGTCGGDKANDPIDLS